MARDRAVAASIAVLSVDGSWGGFVLALEIGGGGASGNVIEGCFLAFYWVRMLSAGSGKRQIIIGTECWSSVEKACKAVR